MFDELEARHWALSSSVFPLEFCQSLAHECQKLQTEGQLNKASIGHGTTKTTVADIRGDFIHWIQEDATSASQQLMRKALDEIQQSLNRHFYLALKRYEAHFAFYPPGTGYDKHIDNHRGSGARKITFILYLNEHWQKNHGGELSLYDPSSPEHLIAKVAPNLGTFVLFRSDLFPHQVEKSFQNRLSVTGWFRDDIL